MCLARHISAPHDQSSPSSAPEEAAISPSPSPSPSSSPSPSPSSSGMMMRIGPLPDEDSCFTLLELAACDDLLGFVKHVEGLSLSLDTCRPWYSRQYGSNKMGMVDRTPLMIAAHHGSLNVVDYMVKKQGVSMNKACGSDRSTALHLAVASGSENSIEIVNLLVKHGADLSLTDAQGLTPFDVFLKTSKKKKHHHHHHHHSGMPGKDVSNGLNELLAGFSNEIGTLPGENYSVGTSAIDSNDDPWRTKTSSTHDNKQESLGLGLGPMQESLGLGLGPTQESLGLGFSPTQESLGLGLGPMQESLGLGFGPTQDSLGLGLDPMPSSDTNNHSSSSVCYSTDALHPTHDNKQESLGLGFVPTQESLGLGLGPKQESLGLGFDPMPSSDTNNHSSSSSSSVYYSTDAFRMYSFKIVPCSRAYSHDWTECPYAHPGENAKRRDPRKHLYSCVPCPDFRKGACKHGDSCEYAHGVFETWLHPAQYRTRMCKDMGNCTRRVCFFAHSDAELRVPKSFTDELDDSSPPPRPPMSRLLAPPYVGSVVGPMLSHHHKGVFNGNLASNAGPEIRPEIRNLAFDDAVAREMILLTEQCHPASSESAHVQATSFSGFRARKLEINVGPPQSLGPDDFFSNSLSPRSPLPTLFPASNLRHWEGLDHHKFGHNVDQLTFSLSMEGESCFMSPPHHHHAHMALQCQQRLHPSSSMNPGSNLRMPSSYTCNERGQFRLPYVSQSLKTLEGPSAWSHNWGSPTGKLEWGVSGDDLSKLRKSSSFQGARRHYFP